MQASIRFGGIPTPVADSGSKKVPASPSMSRWGLLTKGIHCGFFY
jgi:hypothetical protein